MTRLPISFAVQGSDAEGRSDANISTTPFNANVTWQLRTSTFMSVEPMNFVPTVLQARRTPSITLTTAFGLRHTLKLTLSGWKKPSSRSVFHNTQGIENAWAIEEELALSIPTRCLLPPTFVTPHLTRRYSLIVHIKVAGNGKASVRLGIHGVLGDRDQSRQILGANSVSELPVYVP
jgi:hypothetical protein